MENATTAAREVRVLPTFGECLDAVNRSRPTALEWFIYNNEPEDGDLEFRGDLLAALEEWAEVKTEKQVDLVTQT